MAYRNALYALWVAVALYSLSSATLGPKGLVAMKQLEAERKRLAENLQSLEGINQGLGGSIDALRSDRDLIAVYARELGYARPDERFVRIVGVPGTVKRSVVAGNIVAAKHPSTMDDKTLRILSLILGAIVYVALSFRKRRLPVFHRDLPGLRGKLKSGLV